jgi:hypothetical protein
MKRTILTLALGLAAASSLHGTASAAERNLHFVLQPGGLACFQLPAVQLPVQILISESSFNNGTQTPSELLSAVVNQDARSQQMTWLGTNSDGTSRGSNSLAGTVIANLWGGAAPVVNAQLHVCNLARHTIGITQSARTTAIAGNYFVTMFY